MIPLRALVLPALWLGVACTSFDERTTDAGASDAPLPSLDAARPGIDARADVSIAPRDAVSPREAALDARADVARESAPPVDAATADASLPRGDGGSCSGAACPTDTVAIGLLQAGTILVDQTNVYISDPGSTTGNVYECPKSGCSSLTMLGPGFADGLAADSENVYWADFTTGDLYSCAIGGCANLPTLLRGDLDAAFGLIGIGEQLYWASDGDIDTCTAPSCTTVTNVATGQGNEVAEVAVLGTSVFWISSGKLVGCPVSGCTTPTVLTSTTGGNVVAYGTSVYFTDGSAVESCPASLAACNPLVIGSTFAPYGIGTDGADIYWLDDEEDGVFRCRVTGCGGSVETFSTVGEGSPGANVALDGEYAYWSATTAVYRKKK